MQERYAVGVHVQEHVDPSLDPSTVPDPVLAVLADVALICLAEEPSNRPHMREVVDFLQPAAAFKEDTGAVSTVAFRNHHITKSHGPVSALYLSGMKVVQALMLARHCIPSQVTFMPHIIPAAKLLAD